MDRIDSNAVAAPRAVEGGTFGQLAHSTLGRTIRRQQGFAHIGGNGCDIHNHASLSLHGGNPGLQTVECAIEIHSHHPLPLLQRGALNAGELADPCVVHQHVQTSVTGDDVVDHLFPLSRLRDIVQAGLNRPPPGFEVSESRLQFGEINVRRNHHAAFKCKLLRGRPANSTRGTGNQDHSVGKTIHDVPGRGQAPESQYRSATRA